MNNVNSILQSGSDVSYFVGAHRWLDKYYYGYEVLHHLSKKCTITRVIFLW